MPLSTIKDILINYGCEVSLDNNIINISHSGESFTLTVDSDWIKDIKSFVRSKLYDFNLEKREMLGPRNIEIAISRLNQDFFLTRPLHEFTSARNRKVKIQLSSHRWSLFFFTTVEYRKYFNSVVVKRIIRKRMRKFDDLFWQPFTIDYSVPRKKDNSKLLNEAIPAMEACLFKLALENGECWDFSKASRPSFKVEYQFNDEEKMTIPIASYDSNMLKYYKVAISSHFSSQQFLAFYHVLEYNFLSVSDEVLYGRLKSHIHSTHFYGSEEQLEKIISIVKKHSDNSDETEMLMRVLRKYVDEDELIEFINNLEHSLNDKIYSKNYEVFGERFQIQTKKDHAIPNTSKLIKHIRNALVHSSDRYNRDDCHIPLTDIRIYC